MKLAVNLGVFPGGMTLAEQLKVAKEAGCDGVEINIAGELDLEASDQEIKDVVTLASDLGLEIPTVHCGLHWKYQLTDNDASVREKGIDVLKRALEVGAKLGSEVLLVVPGSVSPEVSYDIAYERGQEGVAKLAEKAQEVGLKIGVENVWNKFLLSPLEMRRFIEEINHDSVGAYFDVGNILSYGFPDQWINILAEQIIAVHVKDYRLDVPGFGGFVYLGEGDVPWDAVQAALKNIGWDGYVTAELGPYRYRGDYTVFDIVRSMQRVLGLDK